MSITKILAGSVVAAAIIATGVFANGNYGGRPANPDPENPRTKSIFIYQLQPGAEKHDAMTVTNATDRPVTLELFAVDGTTSHDGSFTCKQNVEDKTDAGGWITLSRKEVSLGAHESTNVDFTVKVPEKADVGEHSACLAVQQKKTASEEAEATGAVRITTRQAVRMAVTIPGDMTRMVDVERFAIEQKNSSQEYNISVKNSGNVSADVDISLRVVDMFGGEWYRNGGQYPVVRDQTLSQQFRNEARPFWGGWYTAKLSIAYDSRPGFFGTDDQQHLTRKDAADITLFFWPTLPAWGVLIGVPLLLTFLIVWRVRRSRRRQLKLRR